MGMNGKPKHIPPSLGSTGHEIYNAWRELKAYPQQVIEATVPGAGLFAFNAYGEMEVVEHIPAIAGPAGNTYRTGYLSTCREPTNEETAALHEAIDRGWIQIEARMRWGAMGSMLYEDAGALVKVYHQATGNPLPEWLETEEGQKWKARNDRFEAELEAKYART